MHKEILTVEQKKLFPWLKEFKKDFGLVGGTAIALHLGHRQSLDFDLFTNKQFGNLALTRKILKTQKIEQTIIDERDELTIVVKGVKVTFLYYPFAIDFTDEVDGVVKMADLLTLAALKAYALGRRAKWKDYVDLYFILTNHYSLADITAKAEKIFGNVFNEKLFRAQLAYFDQIDYSEEADYLIKPAPSKELIKKTLTAIAAQP